MYKRANNIAITNNIIINIAINTVSFSSQINSNISDCLFVLFIQKFYYKFVCLKI